MRMFELQLPRDPTAPFLARAAIAAIGSGLPQAVAADAELLTSEVVANAIVHTSQDPTEPVIVRVEQGDSVRVEVVDHGPVFEADPRRSPGEGGYGLFLVDAVATAWGIEAEGTGKKVWFEVGDAMGLVDVYICLQDAR
jgi:anti-sigma regulatory factor (Ser/Thr protein kinase)